MQVKSPRALSSPSVSPGVAVSRDYGAAVARLSRGTARRVSRVARRAAKTFPVSRYWCRVDRSLQFYRTRVFLNIRIEILSEHRIPILRWHLTGGIRCVRDSSRSAYTQSSSISAAVYTSLTCLQYSVLTADEPYVLINKLVTTSTTYN